MQCPNIREDHGDFTIRHLWNAVTEIAKRRKKPLFIELAIPDGDEDMSDRIDLALRAIKFGIDGINVPGTFKRDEPRVLGSALRPSAAAHICQNLEIMRELAAATKGKIPIRANAVS